MKMARAWPPARATLPQVHAAPLPQVHVAPHDVWAQALLSLRLPQVPAEVEAQEHEAEARALLEQAHEAEAQALLAQVPS